MKFLKYIFLVFVPVLVMSTLLFTSCIEDEDGMHIENPDGAPKISYIRVPDPDVSDSLLVSAQLGTNIVIMGENLGGTRDIWFNDQRASINPTWVTNQHIHVNVPRNAPLVETDQIYIIDAKGDTLKHDFKVTIPPPEVTGAKNEWPMEDENLVVLGDYFFDVTPVVVSFTGGVEAIGTVVSQTELEVEIPEEAVEGPITVSTNFGTTESSFHLWDSRNIILNFDDKLANGWRIGKVENLDNPIDGNYMVVRGDIAANQRDEGPGAPSESELMMEYWGGNDPERTENFYPFYPNSYREYVLKFEAKVNEWYGGHLNLCLAPPDHTGSNQEVWSNSINARALWAPWEEEDAEFSTDGWITVVVPMTEFQYYMSGGAPDPVEYTPNQEFVERAAGSFSTWLLGSPENDGNFIEFYIDNIRFVEQ